MPIMAPCLLDERIIDSFKRVNTYPSVRKYHRRIGEYRGKGAGLIVELTEDENISRYHRPRWVKILAISSQGPIWSARERT